MKKISTIIIAMALLFGMAQCKKQETPATPNAEGNEVYITMKVGGGDRHIVYPGTGAVVYGNGDVIYVGDGSKYLGTLSFNDGVFGGTNMSNEPWNGYWSGDADFGENTAQYYNFEHGWWGSASMDDEMHVRAVLYIDL